MKNSMRNLLILLLVVVAGPILAQELNCKVVVNADQIETQDRRVFRDMELAFSQFLNTRKWTDDQYRTEERINCNLIITISQMPSIGSFFATVQIQSARPIYNSTYESLILNFADREWQFEYVESLPLEFNENVFLSNLTSMLAYYAYIIIGLDYDSFSELGGTPHFQRALNIVNNAQQANRPGWNSLGNNRNRYWLIENLTNPQMVEIRRGLYTYHRLALDDFNKDPDAARQKILGVLRNVKRVRDINPSAILVISFFDAKADELVNIFSDGAVQVKREAFDILTATDPSKRDKYQRIIRN
jgi:hypothetical protein